MTKHVGRHSQRAVLVLVALALAVAGLGATAEAASGPSAKPRLLKPRKKHASFPTGARPLFKVRDHGAVSNGVGVFITVNKHRKVSPSGELKAPKGVKGGTFTGTKRHKHALFTYKPPKYTFAGWYLVTPGKYYWQAQHADCYRTKCHALSKIRSFRIR